MNSGGESATPSEPPSVNGLSPHQRAGIDRDEIDAAILRAACDLGVETHGLKQLARFKFKSFAVIHGNAENRGFGPSRSTARGSRASPRGRFSFHRGAFRGIPREANGLLPAPAFFIGWALMFTCPRLPIPSIPESDEQEGSSLRIRACDPGTGGARWSSDGLRLAA